jgi:hypothetical protein
MAVTSYKLPTSVIQNGTGVNAWADPNNILLVDGDFAVASGPASEILVGGFNISLGQLDTITNITLKVKGYRGSYNTTLAIYAVDDTSGVEISYPYAPSFQGFDGTNTLYTLASSLFGTTWTPDQINNIKIKLIADGTLYLDSIEMAVTYTPGVTPVPVVPSSGQIVVDEFVQGQRFQLAQAMTSTDLFLFAESFNLPDGTPIEYGDFHGEALITVDQGVPGSEENIRISDVEQDYNGTGLVRISIDSLADRGLGFIYPYESDATRIKAHGGTAEFVISNSAPFYNRFLRKNQIDALVSAPIYFEEEGVALADPVHTVDFVGSAVTVTNDGVDSFKKIVTITASAGVQSVTSTDDIIDVDNTDPQNPTLSLDVVELANDPTFLGDIITNINTSGDVSVVSDGITITGDGTTLSPLQAIGATPVLDIQENGVSVENPVNTIDFITNGGIVSTPSAGKVAIDLTALGGGVGGGGTKLAIDTTQVATGGSGVETTFYTIPIPANTLGDNDAIRFSVLFSQIRIENADTESLTFRVKYGGTTLCTLVCNNDVTIANPYADAILTGYIVADNATGAQKAIVNINIGGLEGSFDTPSIIATSYGTATEDSTTPLDLVITVEQDNGGSAEAEAILVEKISSGNGTVINLTAGEDLTAGDTVGYASFIDDTATKAVWAYRINSTTSLGYTVDGVRAICEIDTDKYAILFETTEAGINTPYRAIIAQLDKDTLTWTFGTPSAIIKRPAGDAVALCKVATDKFIVSYLIGTVPAELGVKACTVSGTTITIGAEDTYTSGDNGSMTDMTQLDTDRVALILSTGGFSAQDEVLVEITVSGSTATIGTPSIISGITDGLGLVQKIDTDKIAIVSGQSVYVATVSGGTWTVGTPVTLPSSISTGTSNGQVSINSKDTGEFWVVAGSNSVYYLHYTVSGTVPTLNASGSYVDANNTACSLMTDGTDMFIFTESTTQSLSGVAKLSINGASIDISPFVVTYNSNTASIFSGDNSHIKNMMINANGYYGQLSTDGSVGELDELNIPFHIKGMTNLFTGIAQNTVSRGGTAQVLISGVDENQTGLTAGALYNASEGGIVNTSSQLFNTMQAQSATKLKI